MILGASNLDAQDASFGYNATCANSQVAFCTFKPAQGQLIRASVANWGAAVVVYLVDSATQPTGGGANVTVVDSWPLPLGTATAPSKLDINYIPDALNMSNGVTLLCSSTGLSGGVPTYTAAATCTFTGLTH